MKLIEKKYEIVSDKISEDKSICLAADFHLSHISNDRKFELVRENIYINRPDYICIPGDYIDMSNILDERKYYDKSLLYLESLGKVGKVFLTLGSHDFTRIVNGVGKADLNRNWIKDINTIENVTLLHNQIFCDDQVRFIGYTPTYDYYMNASGCEDEEMLIEDYNRNMSKIDEFKLNILLCHSPICILNDRVLEKVDDIKKMDLILTGHMHNGMVPYKFSELIHNNIGLIAPNKSLFPDNARGIKIRQYDNHKINMIITGGVTKIQETAPKILQFGDNLYNPQIDTIKIKSLKNSR